MNKEIDWNNIDWQGFFNLVHGIDLDGHKEDGLMLMIKAFVVETALPVFTNHQLKYVNEIGCDYVGIDGLRYELKCKKNLRTKTLGHTSPVVLKNNRGNGQHLIKTFTKSSACPRVRRRARSRARIESCRCSTTLTSR